MITDEEVEVLEKNKKPRQLAAAQLRLLLSQCNFKMEQFLATETLLNNGWSNAGTCARIKFTATPISIHMITTGFVQVRVVCLFVSVACVVGGGWRRLWSGVAGGVRTPLASPQNNNHNKKVWLMLLPLGIFHGMPPVDKLHLPWFELLAVFFLSLLLLSCDEVANQLVRRVCLNHVFVFLGRGCASARHARSTAPFSSTAAAAALTPPPPLLARSTHSQLTQLLNPKTNTQEDPFLNLPLFDLSDVSAGHMNRCAARPTCLGYAAVLRRKNDYAPKKRDADTPQHKHTNTKTKTNTNTNKTNKTKGRWTRL